MKNIICSGALFYTLDTNRFLFLHRAKGRMSQVWGLVGGTTEKLETPWSSLKREIIEEVGFLPNIVKTIPFETFVSNDSYFLYHTYICIIENEFIPKLNCEHDGYAWTSFERWPMPMHRGLYSTLQNRSNISKLRTLLDVVEIIKCTDTCFDISELK